DRRRRCNTGSICERTWIRKLEHSAAKHWTTSLWEKLSFKVDKSSKTRSEERCIQHRRTKQSHWVTCVDGK
ncbi:hypothetical protein VIGAN_08364600, partial [Vigna angularis var. angularis]